MNIFKSNLKVPDILYEGRVDIKVDVGVVVSCQEHRRNVTELKIMGEGLWTKQYLHTSYTHVYRSVVWETTSKGSRTLKQLKLTSVLSEAFLSRVPYIANSFSLSFFSDFLFGSRIAVCSGNIYN